MNAESLASTALEQAARKALVELERHVRRHPDGDGQHAVNDLREALGMAPAYQMEYDE